MVKPPKSVCFCHIISRNTPPFTLYFSVSCSHFEVDAATSKTYKYMEDVVSYQYSFLIICLTLLSFYLLQFCDYKYLCKTMHPSSKICDIYCFMAPLTDLLHAYADKVP